MEPRTLARAATNGRTITVFGGTGFLGNRIVRHLRNHEFPVRIASRHPDGGHSQSGPENPQLQSVEANIHDERSVADALVVRRHKRGQPYRERGLDTFTPFVGVGSTGSGQAHQAGPSGLFTFRGSVPAPPRHPATSECGEGERRSARNSPMLSSARL